MKSVILLLLAIIFISSINGRRMKIDLATTAVTTKCNVGQHKTDAWSFDHWDFESGCMKNSKYCADFAANTCKECSWFSKSQKETEVGTGVWCALTWWIWLIACLSGIIACIILIVTLIACFKCCCSKQSEYDRLHS